MTPISTRLQVGLRARLAGPALDRELASACDLTAGDAAVAVRAAVLSSRRGRRRTAAGLRRVLADSRRRPGRSAAVACDREAVALARPALEQLEQALRERRAVRPQGLALARLLLTDPASPLYWPNHPERLYEAARTALLALFPGGVEPRLAERPTPAQVARVS